MRGITVLFLTVFVFPLTSYRGKDLDSDKYLNFVAAIENNSTFSYFTVIKVKNLNNGVVKEICTKGNFILGALHMELKADYDDQGEKIVLDFARSRKDRYFEFRNKKALSNLSFNSYSNRGVEEVRGKYDLKKLIDIIESKGEFAVQLPPLEMKYLSHLLYNYGYMTGENNCVGGALEYVVRPGL